MLGTQTIFEAIPLSSLVSLKNVLADVTYTEFSFKFEYYPSFSNKSEVLFYPLQPTRVCLSKDSNTSMVRLVLDSELLFEKEVMIKNEPTNLNLVFVTNRGTNEYHGQTTNENIFSSILNVEQRAGEKHVDLKVLSSVG